MSEQMPDPDPILAVDDSDVDVDAIMQAIQAAVLARRLEAEAAGQDFERLAAQAWLFSPRRRFPGAVYEALFEAELQADKLHVPLSVAPSRVPFIGPLIERLKRAFHVMVLAYLNPAADRQIVVNRALVRALAGVVESLNRPEAAALEDQWVELEARVRRLEEAQSRPPQPEQPE